MGKKRIFIGLFVLVLCIGASPAAVLAKGYIIRVYFDIFTAQVCDDAGNPVAVCKVTLPRKKIALPQRGIITNIILDPAWHPTSGVKKRHLKKYKQVLADHYPAGHEHNAMGSFKWIPRFCAGEGYYPGDQYTRFHEEKDPARIQTRDSSACIRLLKEDGLRLSSLFKDAERVEFLFTSTRLAGKE